MAKQVCPSCNGDGWINIAKAGNLDKIDLAIIKAVGPEHVRKPCGSCHGKGVVTYD